MAIIGNSKYLLKVTQESELCICLCPKTCEGHTTLKKLQLRYPRLSISIRAEQLKGDN